MASLKSLRLYFEIWPLTYNLHGSTVPLGLLLCYPTKTGDLMAKKKHSKNNQSHHHHHHQHHHQQNLSLGAAHVGEV